MSIGKKFKAAQEKIEDKLHTIGEGVSAAKKVKFANFDETLDITMRLNVDPRHSDQQVRGVVALPAGTGKDIKIAVICKEDKEKAAKDAGADIVGAESIIEDIKAGKIDFDVCIATPDVMGLIGQVARVLGPKGLMPNPKLGTVTPDVAAAVKTAKAGQVEFRVEKAGVIHAGVGKMSFAEKDLESNVNAFVSAVMKSRPSGVKGTFLKSMHISSTMGPSVKIDTSNIV